MLLEQMLLSKGFEGICTDSNDLRSSHKEMVLSSTCGGGSLLVVKFARAGQAGRRKLRTLSKSSKGCLSPMHTLKAQHCRQRAAAPGGLQGGRDLVRCCSSCDLHPCGHCKWAAGRD